MSTPHGAAPPENGSTRSSRPTPIDFRSVANPLDTIIRSGWQPHFSSSYTIVSNDPNLLRSAYHTAITWAESRIAELNLPAGVRLSPANPGDTLEFEYKEVKVSSSSFERSPAAPADTSLPRGAWDLLFNHSDAEILGRDWRISLGAKTLPAEAGAPNRVLLSIASSFRDTVEQPLPQPSVPFLRYLARSIQGYAEIYSGRTELTGSATILDSPQKVYEFMGALRDETRRHPIVLVSAYWTDEGPYYLAEPAEVSGAIRGLGQVYFEGSTPISLGGTTGLANILRRELGIPGDYLTWGGAIRVYRPGDVLALTPNDHRYMQGRDFIDKGDLLERLRNGVYLLAQHDFTADSANPITAGKDIPFFTQMARLDLLRATTTTETAASTPEIAELQRERDDWRKFAEDFDGENIELRKQLTASRGEVSTLKVTVTGLEDMLASLRAENAALYEERKERERAAAASALPPLDPETLSDGASVLTAVKERFSERLSFTAKFERSLLKFEPNNPALFADVYEAIQDLSTIMWNEKFGRRSANFMNEFNAQSRFVFSPTESKLTKEKPGMSDYRADVFEGERFEAWSHLKYGNKPGEQFRIHFDFHEDSERIIVSWVGDHMPTSSSSKTGRRRG